MIKYLSILALGLCACGGSVTGNNAVALTPVTTPHHEAVVEDNSPVTIELARGREAQVLHCSDELQCFQKLTGVCANGYVGGQMLHGGSDKVVGVVFKCISDEEKAAAAKEEAEQKAQEAAWLAARAARIEAEKHAAEEAQKKPAKK